MRDCPKCTFENDIADAGATVEMRGLLRYAYASIVGDFAGVINLYAMAGKHFAGK